MSEDAAPDLVRLCADLAAELDEVTSSSDGPTTAYARAGSEFARVEDTRLAVRLPADISEAAVRTPDTGFDPERRGWVLFTPRDRQRHVLDRAAAWFQTAWRHASDRQG